MSLASKVVGVHEALDAAGLSHQFGGALALAYYVGHPRATTDIDVNVTVPPEHAGRVLEALPQLVAPADVMEKIERDGQVRLWWDKTAVDLFFGYHEFHDYLAATARIVPFADTEIPVLSGEGLVVCKAMFNRTKDWRDIDDMATAGATDFAVARQWLAHLIGEHDPRVATLDQLAARQDPNAVTAVPADEVTRARVNRVLGEFRPIPSSPTPPAAPGSTTSRPKPPPYDHRRQR